MKWPLLSLLTAVTIFGNCAQPAAKNKVQQPVSSEDNPDLFHPNNQVLSSHIEFLYWSAVEGALMYAQKMTQPAWSSGATNAVQGKYENSTYNIDPGLRVSMSFFRAPRFWEIWASYTRLTSRGESSAKAPSRPGEYLTSAWPVPAAIGSLTHANSSLHLNYNVTDFYVDRYFNPNPHLRVRMIAGLTGTWIEQNWAMKYFGSTGFTQSVRNHWTYWGCGMRFGLMGDWFWTNDIYLTARGTLGGFIGPYHNRAIQRTNSLDPTSNNALPIRDGDYRDTRPVGNLQLIVGPSWQKNWDAMRTELFVGYEMNTWTNLQEVYHSTLGDPSDFKETWINTGYIALQGLTARFTIDY